MELEHLVIGGQLGFLGSRNHQDSRRRLLQDIRPSRDDSELNRLLRLARSEGEVSPYDFAHVADLLTLQQPEQGQRELLLSVQAKALEAYANAGGRAATQQSPIRALSELVPLLALAGSNPYELVLSKDYANAITHVATDAAAASLAIRVAWGRESAAGVPRPDGILREGLENLGPAIREWAAVLQDQVPGLRAAYEASVKMVPIGKTLKGTGMW